MRLSMIAIMISYLLGSSTAQALTVDEIIKLKRAGVADSTIELLIMRTGDTRTGGVWKKDGWIIHSTATRFPDASRFEPLYGSLPMAVYPQIYVGRRFWPHQR